MNALDLFAGCGGLSLGLVQAGFDVKLGMDNNAEALATYRRNIPDSFPLEQDIRTLDSCRDILPRFGSQGIDLLAGCAPCQGFSLLTCKYKREDPRNSLLLEMARIIRETAPAAIFMENVPGLLTRGEGLFAKFVDALRKQGYKPSWEVIQMADYGIPQSRRRLVLLAGKGFEIPFPGPSRHKTGQDGKPTWLSLADAIKPYRNKQPVSLSEARTHSSPRKHNWHVVRDIKPITLQRLKAAKPGVTWGAIDENLRPDCHRGGYSGFTNVYGRMTWEQTPVTMTGGCTTFAKGRFGHPSEDRTISVREAACIQTFPRNFRFETDSIDKVCEMIGNAVPPKFAEIFGTHIAMAIQSHTY